MWEQASQLPQLDVWGAHEQSVIVTLLSDIPLYWPCFRVVAGRELALQRPGKRNDLGNRAVQLFRNAVPQFHARQQLHQLGVFIDRYFILPCQFEDGFGQGVVAFGRQGGGLLAVVLEGDGLAGWGGVFHAVSSTQRCSSPVFGPRGGVPRWQSRSPTLSPDDTRRSRRLPKWLSIRLAVNGRLAHSWLDSLP